MLTSLVEKIKGGKSLGGVRTAIWVFVLLGFCFWWHDFVNRLPIGWAWEGATDVQQSYFTWDYFARWIKWWPFPQLMPAGDEHTYPYDMGVMLVDWAFEQALWMYQGGKWLGEGEWFLYYGAISVLVGCLGSFWLLRGVYGDNRAGVFAFLSVLLNFYVGYKQSVHFNIAYIHWLQLGVLVDFLLFRQLVREGKLRLKLVMLRGLFLLLGLGHGLGYVGALNITSFVITLLFGVGWVWHRRWLGTGSIWKLALRASFHGWSEVRGRPFWHCSLLGAMFVVGWLYVPLVLQIVSAITPVSTDSGHYFRFWFSSPLRLFLPYWKASFSLDLFDIREHFYSGMAGWALLSLGIMGWWWAVRGCWFRSSSTDSGSFDTSANASESTPAWVWLLPSGVFFLLLVFNIPRLLPLLEVFPWHSFTRVGGRGTLLYPLLLLLPTLEIDWRHVHKGVFAIWLVVAGTEVHTFASELPDAHSFTRVDRQDIVSYANVIKNTEGTAIFEWPFCLRIRGFRAMCSYDFWAQDIGFLRRHHDKKGLAGGWDIWPPSSLLEKLILQGWPHLLWPEARQQGGIKEPRRQWRCLKEDEYRFLELHLSQHDFAGIQVHEDLMATGCAKEFYHRFGRPTARLLANKEKGTKLAFVPLTDDWRSRHKKNLADNPPVVFFEGQADFVAFERPYGISAKGLKYRSKRLGTIASVGNERYSLGKTTVLYWHVADSGQANKQVQLRARLENLHNGQQIQLLCNSVPIKKWGPLAKNEWLDVRAQCPTISGLNELRLEYAIEGGKSLRVLFVKQLKREGLKGIGYSNVLRGHQQHIATAVRFTTLKLEYVKNIVQ